jgi:pimeloyl-ACP methyl ester carboxylesterase
MGDAPAPATVVLVHGAFHGAWCWDSVVTRLEAARVPVIAVDLPGHGADGGAPADLHTHADWLCAFLRTLDGPLVVVGHSYGGAVISDGAAEVPGVAHLVYLCAIVADAGETMSTVMPGAVPPEETLSQVPAAMLADADGNLVLDRESAAAVFYADCDPGDVEFALARLGPQNPATFGQPVRAAAWRTVPSTYVVCSDDRAVSVGFQRAMATRTSDRVEMATSHSPFLSAPDAVADLFARIARAAGRSG